MEHRTYASRLRYLDAGDVDDSTVAFDGLGVRGHDDAKLGSIDGFIVDSSTGRVYHIVVDSGGWFTSRRFLLPVGHATLDRDAGALRVDVSQDTLREYPEFHEDRFREFSDEDLDAFEQRMAQACCPDERLEPIAADRSRYDALRHYSQPAWWGGRYSAERLRALEIGPYRTRRAREAYDRELVTARDRSMPPVPGEERGEPSPHFEGRAQPGDVLGLETGGERTYIGDTAEDENKRRRDAEDAERERPGGRGKASR